MVVVLGGSCTEAPSNGTTDGEPIFELSADRRVVAIVDPEGFEELLSRSRTEPRPFIQPLVQAYLQEYAKRFPSDVDFLIFLLDQHRDQLRFNALGGFNVTVRSPETGLGPIGPATALPNLPNLRSYIYLARKDSLVLGPSLHELGHAWGVRLTEPDTLGEQISCSDNHWGYTSAGGQLGGWEPGLLVDLGDGRFEIAGGNVEPNGRPFNTLPFSNVELYLMGLVTADEVPTMEVAINPVFENLFRFSADDIVRVSIEEIVRGNGLRMPEPDGAQRHFKLALIFLTDDSPTAEAWQFYTDSMDFFEATEERTITEAFPLSRYRGTPIRQFIEQGDPENPQRPFLNFFASTRGLATLEFVRH